MSWLWKTNKVYIDLTLCSCKVKPCFSQHLHCAALLVKNTPLFAIKYNHVSGRIFFGQSRNRVVITRIMGCHQTALALLQGALCGSSRGQRPNSTGILFQIPFLYVCLFQGLGWWNACCMTNVSVFAVFPMSSNCLSFAPRRSLGQQQRAEAQFNRYSFFKYSF